MLLLLKRSDINNKQLTESKGRHRDEKEEEKRDDLHDDWWWYIEQHFWVKCLMVCVRCRTEKRPFQSTKYFTRDKTYSLVTRTKTESEIIPHISSSNNKHHNLMNSLAHRSFINDTQLFWKSASCWGINLLIVLVEEIPNWTSNSNSSMSAQPRWNKKMIMIMMGGLHEFYEATGIVGVCNQCFLLICKKWIKNRVHQCWLIQLKPRTVLTRS